MPPRSSSSNHLRLKEPDHRLGEGIIEGIPAAAHRGRDSGVGEAVAVASATLRNCPDVAMVAENIEIIGLGTARSVSGTSASSPLWRDSWR